MAIGRGSDRSPPRKIVKLKVDFTKLNNSVTPRKLVTMRVDPKKLSELVVKLNNEDDWPFIRFRYKTDLKKRKAQFVGSSNTVVYRPRVSNPPIFSSFLDDYPDCFARFKGLYFYIDFPRSNEELPEAKRQWITLFSQIGQNCGSIDHLDICWGGIWPAHSAARERNPLSIDMEVLEALATIEVERYVRVSGAYEKSACIDFLKRKMVFNYESGRFHLH